MPCLDDRVLGAFSAGGLTAADRAAADDHLAECEKCRQRVGERAETGNVGPAGGADTELATADWGKPGRRRSGRTGAGDAVGHHILLREVGSGGMGKVFVAYDPDLDRNVALKLLHANIGAGRSRLRSEAKALARLSHPNVVAIHEIDEWRGQDYIVMEYVEGGTLADWLAAGERGWREVVAKFIAAGAGLAAAHQAGLVHRDVKPSNILVGDDGRVRVTDFGLARTEVSDVTDDGDGLAHGQSETLTQPGTILGTPRYMSPEQRVAATVDARSDQFSFCVSLYEGLYGEAPYPGATSVEISTAVMKGEVAPAPAGTQVPRWLRQVVVRGLRFDPAQRFASLEELLAGLAPRSRRKWWMMGAALAMIALTAVLSWRALERSRAATCDGAEARVEAVWNESARAAMRAAFVDRGGRHGADRFKRTAAILTRYGEAWKAAHVEACVATNVEHRQGDEVLDLRMRCLERRLGEFAALVDLLIASADPKLVDQAIEVAGRLPNVDRCADVEVLAAVVAPPHDPRQRQQVDELSAALAEIGALHMAGKYAEAGERAEGVAAAARATGYGPVVAAALFALGRARGAAGAAEAGELAMREAVRLAAAAHDDHLTAAAWIALIDIVGDVGKRFDEALALRAPAEAAVARAGSPAALTVELESALGVILRHQGKYADARELHIHSLAIIGRSIGADSVQAFDVASRLGVVARHQGRYAEARGYYQRCLAIGSELFGAEHPRVAGVLYNLSTVDQLEGRHAEAAAGFARAEEVFVATFGPTHPNVAMVSNARGAVAETRGEYARARGFLERGMGILTEHHPGHPSIAIALNSLGIVATAEDKFAEAEAYHRRALALHSKVYGDEHPRVGRALYNIGEALTAQGKCAAALGEYARGLVILEKVVGAAHPDVSRVLAAIGECHLRAQHPGQARPPLERAFANCASNCGAPRDRARIEFALAQALWPVKGERKRASELAAAARARWVKVGGRSAEQIARVDLWLQHRQK